VPRTVDAGPSRRAAVLVPLREMERGDELEVVLTRRSAALAAHSGQVAFPGGAIDPTDATEEAAALREAWEELSIPVDRVEVIVRLDDLITGTGFHIAPVAALLERDVTLVPSAGEVARVFALPLSEVLREERWETREHQYRGATIRMPHLLFDGEDVWGATAFILRRMAELL
jgi:8-oxo-dGTP pyrophosphatase MutT (NUDIX family)